jgi:hypothetical protein
LSANLAMSDHLSLRRRALRMAPLGHEALNPQFRRISAPLAAQTNAAAKRSIMASIMEVSRPLDSFPILRSGNLEEIRQALFQSYSARRLNFPHSAQMFEFYANHWQSQNLGLSYLTGVPFQLEFPTADFFRQAFILGGADIRFD